MVIYAAHLQNRVMFEMTDQPQPTSQSLNEYALFQEQSILLEKGIIVSGRYRDLGAQIVLSLSNKIFWLPTVFVYPVN